MTRAIILAMAAFLATSCVEVSPEGEYRDFLDRTADARVRDTCDPDMPPPGAVVDLRGRWLLRALLNGGLSIGLRIEFEARDDAIESPPRRLRATIWLWDQPDDAEPSLVVEEVNIDEEWRFKIEAHPLNLGSEVLGNGGSVVADVTLDSHGVSPDGFCGLALGSVTSPITLDLMGSTLYAQRNPNGDLQLDDIPFECPDDGCGDAGPDASMSDDAGVDAGVVIRPESPDLSDVSSIRADLTGDWAVMASLGGFPVRMWITLADEAAGVGAGPLTGALRLADDAPDSEARTVFETTVDADGLFEVWLPGFTLELPALNLAIAGDLLLSAATIDTGWCGRGAGQVMTPIELDLAGSTFNAIPWTPGEVFPEDIPSNCEGE